jgi:restriction system protein
MARSSAIGSFIRAAARASAAAERERQRATRSQVTQARQLERHARMSRNQQIRDSRDADRASKVQYLEDRADEVNDLNEALEERIEELRDLLPHTLEFDDRISFDSLRDRQPFGAFSPPADLAPSITPRLREVAPLTGFGRFIPGATGRREKQVSEAADDHRHARSAFDEQEQIKRAKLAELERGHEERKALHEQEQHRQNAGIDEFEDAYLAKAPEAIVGYYEMVLARSEYPNEGFPQKFKVAYGVDSAELVVEYDLPEPSVVPDMAEYKYVTQQSEI